MENSQLEKIGLGTWAFGGRAYGPMADEVALSVANRAYHLGIRFYDTAHIYASGRSEELLGEVFGSEKNVNICTKIGYDISTGKPVKRFDDNFLDKSLSISLQRLKRKPIDLLMLHNPPTNVLENSSIYKWLNSQIERGHILRWGVSVYDSVRDAELALDAGAKAIEARYSLIRRDIIDELSASKWQFDFIARSPLDGGLLTGKYIGGETFPKTDQRSAKDLSYIRTNREFLAELQSLVDDGIVQSFAELAIRFVAFAPAVSIVIPGAKSIEQLEQNINAVNQGPLPSNAVTLINNLREKYLSLLCE